MPRTKPQSAREALERWPILTSHLICQSLGYFTPIAAGRALYYYANGLPNFCEWYDHMASFQKSRPRSAPRTPTPTVSEPTDRASYEMALLEVGERVVRMAIAGRRGHRGYMADYPRARALVEHVRNGGEGPIFASWF